MALTPRLTVRLPAPANRGAAASQAAIAASVHAATSKTTPVDADEIGIIDSAASNVLKKLTFANLKAWVWSVFGALIAGGTSKATPVDADTLPLSDSAASGATKKLPWADLKATLFASPVFTGNPRGVTPGAGDNDTTLATTEWVTDWIKLNAVIQLAFTGGSSTAYTTTSAVNGAAVMPAVGDGQKFLVRFHVACGEDPTLSIDGFAFAIKTESGNDINANDIKAGRHYILYFNGSYLSIINRYVTPEELATEAAARNDGEATINAAKENKSDKGVANGYASLNSSGTVPLAQMDPALTGGRTFKGTWNASTNSPSLASGVGTLGDFYIVATAGSTTLDGISTWAVNDQAMFNGTIWQKIAFAVGSFASNGDIDAGTATDKPVHTAGLMRGIDEFAFSPPQGRLSLLSSAAVSSTTNSILVDTIYYQPYFGDRVPIWDGRAPRMWPIYPKLEMELDPTSGHTGYHQSGRIYDVFIILVAGVPRLATSPAWSGTAWSDDQTRSGAIDLLIGYRVNTSSMVMRYGSGSGDTATVASRFGTYVGTMMASADGKCDQSIVPNPEFGGADNKLFLWNYYNRVDHHSINREKTASWTDTVDIRKKVFSSEGNKISFVCGYAEDALHSFHTILSSNTTANVIRRLSIGWVHEDSPSAHESNSSVEKWVTSPAGILLSEDVNHFRRPNNAGYNTHFPIIRSEATGVTTWYGGGNQEFRIAFLM